MTAVLEVGCEPRPVTLTAREAAVVAALVHDGADNSTLARRLGVTVETAKTLLRRAMRKAGTPTRTALVVAVLRDHITVTVRGATREAA